MIYIWIIFFNIPSVFVTILQSLFSEDHSSIFSSLALLYTVSGGLVLPITTKSSVFKVSSSFTSVVESILNNF